MELQNELNKANRENSKMKDQSDKIKQMWSALDKMVPFVDFLMRMKDLKTKLDEMSDHFAYILKNHGAEEARNESAFKHLKVVYTYLQSR